MVEPTELMEQAEDALDSLDVSRDSDDLVEEELLVEEISIDGMCGVY